MNEWMNEWMDGSMDEARVHAGVDILTPSVNSKRKTP